MSAADLDEWGPTLERVWSAAVRVSGLPHEVIVARQDWTALDWCRGAAMVLEIMGVPPAVIAEEVGVAKPTVKSWLTDPWKRRHAEKFADAIEREITEWEDVEGQ